MRGGDPAEFRTPGQFHPSGAGPAAQVDAHAHVVDGQRRVGLQDPLRFGLAFGVYRRGGTAVDVEEKGAAAKEKGEEGHDGSRVWGRQVTRWFGDEEQGNGACSADHITQVEAGIDPFAAWTGRKGMCVGEVRLEPGVEAAGSLESLEHGFFTWLVVGALRGWADGEVDGRRDGAVNAVEAGLFVERG